MTAMPFDPDAFMNQTIDDPMATSLQAIPEGEYETLAGKYVDPAVLQKNNSDVEALFGAGKFAVTTDGPWLAAQLLQPASVEHPAHGG